MTGSQDQLVVGVDGSGAAAAALDWAVAEARARRCGLRAVYAYGEFTEGLAMVYGRLPEPDRAEVVAASQQLLDAALSRVAELDATLPVTGAIIEKAPPRALLDEAAHAGLLVIGSRGLKAFGAAVLGSVGAAVAGRAACPVVVVRGAKVRPGKDAAVVVGVDATDATPAVLRFAFEHASRHALALRVVLCWRREPLTELAWRPASPPPQAERWLAESLAGWREQYPEVAVRGEIVRDQAAAGLVGAAQDQRLLVVGARGRHSLAGTLLGSVSQAVLHHATCPVAVVPVSARD